MKAPKCILMAILFLGIVLSIQTASAASGLFAKMPAATNAYVVNIQGDQEHSWDTAWVLEGLINQRTAEVYVMHNPWDREQLQASGKQYEELPRLTGADEGLMSLFQKYPGRATASVL